MNKSTLLCVVLLSISLFVPQEIFPDDNQDREQKIKKVLKISAAIAAVVIGIPATFIAYVVITNNPKKRYAEQLERERMAENPKEMRKMDGKSKKIDLDDRQASMNRGSESINERIPQDSNARGQAKEMRTFHEKNDRKIKQEEELRKLEDQAKKQKEEFRRRKIEQEKEIAERGKKQAEEIRRREKEQDEKHAQEMEKLKEKGRGAQLHHQQKIQQDARQQLQELQNLRKNQEQMVDRALEDWAKKVKEHEQEVRPIKEQTEILKNKVKDKLNKN
jgi:hypothetical protein